jgi:hypothetical protein
MLLMMTSDELKLGEAKQVWRLQKLEPTALAA